MKHTLLAFTLLASTSLIGASALAKPSAKSEKEKENAIATRFIEQILNSIQAASIDINIKNMAFIETTDEKTDEKKTEVKMNDVGVKAMLSFGSDWTVDLIVPKEGTPKNAQIEKIYPKLTAGADNLELGFEVKMTSTTQAVRAEFFSGYNKKIGQWEPRPLVIGIANKMNSNLLKIRLHSLNATTTVNAKNPKVKYVNGTCKSDKILFDFISGQNRQVEVNCQFSGTMTETGHNIVLKWENK